MKQRKIWPISYPFMDSAKFTTSERSCFSKVRHLALDRFDLLFDLENFPKTHFRNWAFFAPMYRSVTKRYIKRQHDYLDFLKENISSKQLEATWYWQYINSPYDQLERFEIDCLGSVKIQQADGILLRSWIHASVVFSIFLLPGYNF